MSKQDFLHLKQVKQLERRNTRLSNVIYGSICYILIAIIMVMSLVACTNTNKKIPVVNLSTIQYVVIEGDNIQITDENGDTFVIIADHIEE